MQGAEQELMAAQLIYTTKLEELLQGQRMTETPIRLTVVEGEERLKTEIDFLSDELAKAMRENDMLRDELHSARTRLVAYGENYSHKESADAK